MIHSLTLHPEFTRATRHPLISYYADPSRSLYYALGMSNNSSPMPTQKLRPGGYITIGRVVDIAKSVVVSSKGCWNGGPEVTTVTEQRHLRLI